MKERYVLCDTSSLISLTGSCLENALRFFQDNFNVRFFIPPSVEHEAVTRPLSLTVKIHNFSALRIQKLIDDGVLTIVDEDLKKETAEFMKLGNSVFYARGKPLRIFHKGELEMIALAQKLQIDSLLMDERTTRLLVEDPEVLRDHLQTEFKTSILVNRKNLSNFLSGLNHMNVIRTTELIYLAYTKGFFRNFGKIEKAAAEASLYSLKYAGCAVSFNELQEYEKLIG